MSTDIEDRRAHTDLDTMGYRGMAMMFGPVKRNVLLGGTLRHHPQNPS